MFGPRSFRMRMCSVICPPSKRTLRLDPERAPAPFWPRPAVLPVPEPSPRPTRLRAVREPGAGLSVCSPMRGSSAIDSHQMPDAVDHAPRLLVVLDLDAVADPAQAERAQRVELRLVRPVARLHLRHLHAAGVSSGPGSGAGAGAASSAASASAGGSSPRACRPSTALT